MTNPTDMSEESRIEFVRELLENYDQIESVEPSVQDHSNAVYVFVNGNVPSSLTRKMMDNGFKPPHISVTTSGTDNLLVMSLQFSPRQE